MCVAREWNKGSLRVSLYKYLIHTVSRIFLFILYLLSSYCFFLFYIDWNGKFCVRQIISSLAFELYTFSLFNFLTFFTRVYALLFLTLFFCFNTHETVKCYCCYCCCYWRFIFFQYRVYFFIFSLLFSFSTLSESCICGDDDYDEFEGLILNFLPSLTHTYL